MQYAIELYYDKETEDKLDVDEAQCIEKLKIFAKNHHKMPAYIGSIGMFNDTKTIFVSPIMNSSMYQFHRELCESLDCFDTKGWEWYCPDRWVPHCTIALTKEDNENAFFQASDLLLHEFRKMNGEFVSIGLVKITFPVEEIFTMKLS